ncbi:hypothetical protein C3402_17300, partial [Pantoea sp. PSNIH3]
YQLIPVNLKHKVKNSEGKEEWINYQAEIAPNSAMMKLPTCTFSCASPFFWNGVSSFIIALFGAISA